MQKAWEYIRLKGFLYQPQFHTLDELETLSAQAGITYPLVVKPNREGTSMGLSLVKNKDEFLAAVGRIVRTYKQEVRCDEYIGGHELAVPILGTGAEAEVLGIVEYCEQDGGIMPFYTAEKKEHGNHRTEWEIIWERDRPSDHRYGSAGPPWIPVL